MNQLTPLEEMEPGLEVSVDARAATRGLSVHPKQEEIAEKILEKIKTALQTINTSAFNQFAFSIMVPMMCSLYNQTAARVAVFLEEYQESKAHFLADADKSWQDMADKFVFKAGPVREFRSTSWFTNLSAKPPPPFSLGRLVAKCASSTITRKSVCGSDLILCSNLSNLPLSAAPT